MEHPISHLPSNIYEFSKNLLVGVPIIESRKTLTLYLATVKNQYYSWLMKETVARGPENINLEMAVISMANLFNSMDVRSINHGFKKTGLSLFQSEPTIEVELTREEQILNLYERFAIGKGTHLALTEWNTNVIGNFVGQR